ncbi:uncharacterized protein Z519_12669 [Cladophialophora bantiana CBS 173.52]|uniref:DNA (cytosine-5-)-methyltransferase n=1 Tax=Cladophialophora bantiana (strain ATCC 10958 / CBS 173.52 / CDC B-1940 / NIH 8579) TaxID=1442370 RepID=A0A0D2E9E1_CLAB1|nr:uncharacterized protein Z519_12669 [Cladophialophora bantiana CBS 173.52]KIW86756.1 hypothetical protein Z519_12669 [Cladophialophora bantiana CBS 173.52]
MASKEVVLDRDAFGTHIVRTLKVSMALHPKLRDLDLRFVDGGGTKLEIAFNHTEKQVLVHAKWLQFLTAHKMGPCEVLRLTDDGQLDEEAFFCDHVVEELFNSLLSIIGREQLTDVRRTMREQLRLMPRLVQVIPTKSPNELEVRWIGNGGLMSTYYSRNIRYLVTLHRVTSCQSRSNDLLHDHRTESPVADGASRQSESDSRTESVITTSSIFQWSQDLIPVHSSQHLRSLSHLFGLSHHLCRVPGPADADHPDFATEVVDFNDATNICDHRDEIDQDMEVVHRESPVIDVKPPIADFETQNLPTPQSSSLEGIEPILKEVDALPLFEQDQDYWRQWHAEELPGAFSKLLAHRERNDLRNLHPVASLEWPDLNFQFVKDEYALIRIGRENPLEHVIFIHEISYCAEEAEISGARLLVTKYSKLVSNYPAPLEESVGEDEDEIENGQELLLHFGDFGNMGTRHDAESIQISDIVFVTELVAGVDHVLALSPVVEHDAMYCRFTIKGSTSNSTAACWTPLSSDLLSRRDRWRGPQFNNISRPAVVNFTPGILGPAEGFSQAVFDIQAAMGFDQERHLSWKIRHTQSQIYDGSPRDALDDIKSKQLRPPCTSEPAPPKIALVAGGNAPFRLSEANQKMPPIEQFVSPLDPLDAAINTPRKPDFLNTRVGLGPERAFLCSAPLEMQPGDEQADKHPSHVYNHQTGQVSTSSWKIPLLWETDALEGLSCDPQPWTHPDRQDLLTVRELARLQGFPDDFVFFRSLDIQYEDVWTALPPVLSRLVGKTILQVIQGSLKAKAGDRQESLRASKRHRSENDV